MRHSCSECGKYQKNGLVTGTLFFLLPSSFMIRNCLMLCKKRPHSPHLARKALVMQATDIYWPVMQLAYHSPFITFTLSRQLFVGQLSITTCLPNWAAPLSLGYPVQYFVMSTRSMFNSPLRPSIQFTLAEACLLGHYCEYVPYCTLMWQQLPARSGSTAPHPWLRNHGILSGKW